MSKVLLLLLATVFLVSVTYTAVKYLYDHRPIVLIACKTENRVHIWLIDSLSPNVLYDYDDFSVCQLETLIVRKDPHTVLTGRAGEGGSLFPRSYSGYRRDADDS